MILSAFSIHGAGPFGPLAKGFLPGPWKVGRLLNDGWNLDDPIGFAHKLLRSAEESGGPEFVPILLGLNEAQHDPKMKEFDNVVARLVKPEGYLWGGFQSSFGKPPLFGSQVDIVTVNAYRSPNHADDSYTAFRHDRYPQDYGGKPVLIGEFGFDAEEGMPKLGYRSRWNEREYLAWLIEADQRLAANPQVIGACIFCLGSGESGQWSDFDISGYVLDGLKEYERGSPWGDWRARYDRWVNRSKPMANVRVADRDVSKLDPGFIPHVERLLRELTGVNAGLESFVIEARRTPERQRWLKDQGKSWTLESHHITGRAVDIAFKGADGKVHWRPWSIYERAGEVGEQLGFTWGGRWRVRDGVHFEMPTLPSVGSGVSPDGELVELRQEVAAWKAWHSEMQTAMRRAPKG